MGQFQNQFPLNVKRKFWKKLLSNVIPILIIGVGAGALSAGVLPLISESLSLVAFFGTGIGIAIVITILLLAFDAWYLKVFIRNYFYDANENFITIKKGVFTPKEIHVQYAKIQDVYVDQDLLDRIMGLYDVHLASATVTSGMEAHIDGVNKDVAEGLKNFLLGRIQGGAMPPTANVQSNPQQAAPAQANSAVQFSEEISNNTYPLAPGWFLNQTIIALFLSVVIGGFAVLYATPNTHENANIVDMFPGHYLGMFLIVAIGYFIIHSISNLIWNSNYRFAFTPDYILLHTGVLSQSETHLPYRSVQDVNVSQNIVDLLFGMARVSIESAAVVQNQNGRRKNAAVQIVGLRKEQANHIVEVLKPVLLTHNTTQTGL